MNDTETIEDFLSEGPWAVVGASQDRSKYGNMVLRAYQQAGKSPLWPVNPKVDQVEGERAFPDLASLPGTPRVVSIITPPEVTEAVVEEAAELGVRRLWMQPGSESDRALERAEELGLEVLAGGPCVLVALRFQG